MFPAKHTLVSHLNTGHQKYLQVRKKIGPEVIFTLNQSISDIVFELSNQNEPLSLCVRVMFFELIWTFSKQIWTSLAMNRDNCILQNKNLM